MANSNERVAFAVKISNNRGEGGGCGRSIRPAEVHNYNRAWMYLRSYSIYYSLAVVVEGIQADHIPLYYAQTK